MRLLFLITIISFFSQLSISNDDIYELDQNYEANMIFTLSTSHQNSCDISIGSISGRSVEDICRAECCYDNEEGYDEACYNYCLLQAL